MKTNLGDRHKAYEKACDYSIIKRLPIIIRVDGRGFTKLTRDVPKPYCKKMSAAMAYAMFESIKVIDSAAFGYTQSDECTFVLWPSNKDADPWFGNRIQKMASITSATFTYHFNQFTTGANRPNIKGPAIFDARVFSLPSISEVINNLIWRQQDCRVNAVSSAAMAEMGRKYGRREASSRLQGKKTGERIVMLKEECDIDFEEEYPGQFKMGIAAYKAPKIVQTESGGPMTKTKWILDTDPPNFIDDRMFLLNYFHTGSDIFRPERDIIHSD